MRGFIEYIVVAVVALIFTLYHAVLTALVIEVSHDVPIQFWFVFGVEILAFLPIGIALIAGLWLSKKKPVYFSEFSARVIATHFAAAFILFSIHAVWQQYVNSIFFDMGFSMNAIQSDFMRFLEMRFFVYIIIIGLAGGLVKLKERQEAIQRETRLKKELYKAKVKEIELKMNPEIIYSNLDFIKRKAEENVKEASQMVILMAGMLRKLIDNLENEKIPIHEDMQFFQMYMNMVCLRSEKMITTHTNLQGVSPKFEVPSLILLIPIFEKLFFGEYALHSRSINSVVHIARTISNDRVLLEIRCSDLSDEEIFKTRLKNDPLLENINNILNGMFEQLYIFHAVTEGKELLFSLEILATKAKEQEPEYV